MIRSRGTYILYFLATAIILWQTKSKKIIVLGILALFFIGALFGYMTMRKVKEGRMNILNASDIGRISTNITGLRMWRESPVIGIGYGTSRYRYKEFEDKNVFAITGMYDIHNIYVAQLAETGIIGFLLFGLFNGILIVKLINRYKSNGKFYKDKYSLFYILSITTFLSHGLVYHTFEGESYYWFILAAAVLYIKEDDENVIDYNFNQGPNVG
jgi:O-antigen ligase